MELVLKYFADFTDVQLHQFAMLEPLYKQWNEKINIISRKDIHQLYEKHVLHSLSIAASFDFQPRMQVLDLGTGGGFPGLPLAIFFPEVHFHLVDSIGKKLQVIDAVVAASNIKNITTQHIRAENINDKKFDVIVSRAVAPLKDLWQWGKPLLVKKKKVMAISSSTTTSAVSIVPHGLICLKGGDLAQEISASSCKPKMIDIQAIFSEDYFKEKYLLYVPLTP